MRRASFATSSAEASPNIWSEPMTVARTAPTDAAHGLDPFRSRSQALFKDVTIMRELHDAGGNDDHAFQILEMTASVEGRSHTWYAVWSMHVQEGQFSEAWLYVDGPVRAGRLPELAGLRRAADRPGGG